MSPAREFDFTSSSKLTSVIFLLFSIFWFTCRSCWLLTFFLRFSVVSTIFIMEFIHPSWRVRLLLSSYGNTQTRTYILSDITWHWRARFMELYICINYRTSRDKEKRAGVLLMLQVAYMDPAVQQTPNWPEDCRRVSDLFTEVRT